MSAELLMNVTPQETRIAVIENGSAQEIMIERSNHRGLVGNIYKGRVNRVLPGMQAAFVDIGLERTAFLHASDIAPTEFDEQEAGHTGRFPARPVTGADFQGDPRDTEITRLLHDGKEILVQVIKDPIGSKGARLTTHLSIPACYVVFMPGENIIGISQKIEDETERQRLRELCRHLDRDLHGSDQDAAEPAPSSLPDGPVNGPVNGPVYGYIVRTAAESVSEVMLRKDMEFLDRLWHNLQERSALVSAPSIVHEDLSLSLRTLRELGGIEIERIRVDSRETYRRLVEFTRRYIPELTMHIEHYGGERPIFDLYGVEDEIKKALQRKVQLKSGGHLVFDQTEAMTTVDVNTGAYVGHRNLEETIFKTNLEAAQAIARQLRLRNLGGIIIIDFIDMKSDEHRRQVLRALERSLDRDPTRSHVSSVSPLGLVQMTRKRTRESLEYVLSETCPTCEGRGTIKSPDTVCYEIFREILREARQFEPDRLLVLASPEVIETLIDDESASFAELEAFIGKPITLQTESLYPREQYDVVLM